MQSSQHEKGHSQVRQECRYLIRRLLSKFPQPSRARFKAASWIAIGSWNTSMIGVGAMRPGVQATPGHLGLSRIHCPVNPTPTQHQQQATWQKAKFGIIRAHSFRHCGPWPFFLSAMHCHHQATSPARVCSLTTAHFAWLASPGPAPASSLGRKGIPVLIQHRLYAYLACSYPV